MKKFFAAIFLSWLATSAYADCSIPYTANQFATSVIDGGGGLKLRNFDSICEKLDRAGASLVIADMSSVLKGRETLFVYVTVYDRRTHVVVPVDYNLAVKLSPDVPSKGKINTLAYDSTMQAIDGWGKLDVALAKLDQQRNRLGISK